MAAIDSPRAPPHLAGMATIHATCVALGDTGILLRGRSGSGKSDLALRLIDGGALLVADDRVALSLETGRVVARPPAALAGYLEIRGVGPMPVPSVAAATVSLVVDLADRTTIERLPVPRSCAYLGVILPLAALDPFEISAAAKLRMMAQAVADTAGAWPSVFTP
jgi:HPr kinase/phosphorylase